MQTASKTAPRDLSESLPVLERDSRGVWHVRGYAEARAILDDVADAAAFGPSTSSAPARVRPGLALFATLFGGWQRFLGGFQDIYRRKITVNVFVTVALIATLAIGEFRPAAQHS